MRLLGVLYVHVQVFIVCTVCAKSCTYIRIGKFISAGASGRANTDTGTLVLLHVDTGEGRGRGVSTASDGNVFKATAAATAKDTTHTAIMLLILFLNYK